MVDYLLGNAVGQNHLERAEWLLERGADPNATHAYTKQPLHALAQLSGFQNMIALLERHGAEPAPLSGLEAFLAAVLRCDEAAARAGLKAQPELIHDPQPLLAAAMHGNVGAIELLLALGADPHGVDQDGISPLHRAVQSGSLAAVDRLLGAGADVELRERRWGGTPMSWTIALGKPHVATRLAPLSRDVRAMARLPDFERLKAVLEAEPALANHRVASDDAPTPLFCLPNDEDAAVEAARILLSFGADPGLRSDKGQTAVEAARARGLDEAAELMEDASHGA
jgi:ankyrin repeat protein